MDEIFEHIKDFKKVLNANINIDTFLKLISHCTDGEFVMGGGQYANALTIEEWKTHFEYAKINVSPEQIKEFFEYLIKYRNQYFNNVNGDVYAVKKGFNLKGYENFEFECIVYYSINS